MTTWSQIIKDESGQLSSARASLLIGVLSLSVLMFVMVWLKPDDVIGIVVPYCGLCATPYGIGKWQDSATKRKLGDRKK